MRGDFSRLTFRPENHYSGVRLQQGRVQLDSEFNEHVDIEAHRDRETARDVIGRAGAPQDGGGFRVGIAAMLRGVSAPGDAWAVGEDGTVLQASGGGAWALADRPAGSGRLNAVDLHDAATGWAVGDGAATYRLGGAAAVAVPAPDGVTADLHGVYVASATAATAVGAAGTVLVHDGTQWKADARDAGVSATLRAVHGGTAVGDQGTILAAGAAGWAVQATPADTGDLYGVFVLDAAHRWAVGEQGTILFSSGAEWTRIAPSLTSTLRAVVFANATNGTAVGDAGTILATTDGGATWTRQVVPDLRADLHDVVARADGTLLAVGDDVALARSAAGAWTRAPGLPADAATGERQGRTLVLSAGDMYVDGIRCENGRTVSLGAQSEPPLAGVYRAPGAAGTFGVYLQVQEQHLTAVEREELREVALGGPDTATRTRTVWQADLVRLAAGAQTCADVAPAVRPAVTRGRLRARAKPAAVTTASCIVPPTGGYERLENQLYRVEIHAPSGAGPAGFKWSRDNASMVARLEQIDTQAGTVSVTVSQVGRDATLGFGPEQLVEITDEGRMLRGEPGVLAAVGEIDGNTLILDSVDQTPLTLDDFPDRPLVRRWDGRGDATALPAEHELESGVFVAFDGGALATGDHWTIPARTLSGAVEWPSEGGVPGFQEPQGPGVHLTALALVTLDAKGAWSAVRDCRREFPPLTDLVRMSYAGGDGQEVMPTYPLANNRYVALAAPLRVAVANGRRPVAGATVRFKVEQGAGRLRGSDNGFGADVAVVTAADGIAACPWELAGAEHTQIVTARLSDPLGQSPPQAVTFNAHLSIATKVAYDGSWCPRLAGGATVADALDTMSRLTRIFPLTGSGEDVVPGETIAIEVLVADGCGPVDNATVQFTAPSANGSITNVQGTTVAGIARCVWTPDPWDPTKQNATQHLSATLQAVPGSRTVHVPSQAQFTANLSIAADIQYTPPANCPELANVVTVQAAINRLSSLLPRLYYVSGDGVEGRPGDKVQLRAGIANRCGAVNPAVRFEQQTDAGWSVAPVPAFDAQTGIATLDWQLTEQPQQVLRATLLAGNTTLGYPVYFNLRLRPAGGDTGDKVVPAARLDYREVGIVKPGETVIVKFDPNALRFDTDGLFDGETRLRASREGTYVADAELTWDAKIRDGMRAVELLQDGEPLSTVAGAVFPEGTATVHHTSAVIRLQRGEFVELRASSGSQKEAPITRAVLTLAWLGP